MPPLPQDSVDTDVNDAGRLRLRLGTRGPDTAAYLMSTAEEKEVQKADGTIIEVTAVIKADPVTASSTATTVSSMLPPPSTRPPASSPPPPTLPSRTSTDGLPAFEACLRAVAPEVEATDKMVITGPKMDGAELKETAMAHASPFMNEIALEFRPLQREPGGGRRGQLYKGHRYDLHRHRRDVGRVLPRHGLQRGDDGGSHFALGQAMREIPAVSQTS